MEKKTYLVTHIIIMVILLRGILMVSQTFAETDMTPPDIHNRMYGENSSKAIIVAGGGQPSGTYRNRLWESTRTCADYAYGALLHQGYTGDDILYLTPNTENDGNADRTVTHENMSYAIRDWAKNADADLLLYLTGHGGNGSFRLNDREMLRAEELDAWLDELQKTMSGRLIFIYDACQSGTFLPLMTPPLGKKRIVISSTADEPARFLPMGRRAGGLSFSFQFWAHIYYGGKLNDAFFFAKDMMERFQTALLDADGNGVGNEHSDKKLANDILIAKKNPSVEHSFLKFR